MKPIGVLKMEDDGGGDEKIIAVPSAKLTKRYAHIQNYTDLPEITWKQIEHFFLHYKDLEPASGSSSWAGVTPPRRGVADRRGDRASQEKEGVISFSPAKGAGWDLRRFWIERRGGPLPTFELQRREPPGQKPCGGA